MKSHLDLNLEVIEKADNSRYANGDDLKLVNLRPIASFSKSELTTSTRKHLENLSNACIVFLMYKLITSSRGSDDLFIGSDRERLKRQQELTNNKNVDGKYHVGIMLRDVFGFAEHQEKATYGLGNKLTLTRNEDDVVLKKDGAIADARNKIDNIQWYVPH